MGCGQTKVACDNNVRYERNYNPETGMPINPLDAVSVKRSDDVEEFFRRAYQYGSHVGILREFLTSDTARSMFLEFLELEYFAKSPDSFKEAAEFLNHEIVNRYLESKEGAQGLVTRENSSSKIVWNEEVKSRYSKVMTEIGTVAFKKFLKSKMYTNFRSYERGALSYIRADDVMKDPNSYNENYVSCNVPSARSESNKPTSISISGDYHSSRRRSHDSMSSSFARRAFDVVDTSVKDRVLLHGSTWLSLLIAGVESCPLGFCLISTSSQDDIKFPIVAVNSYLEHAMGCDRSKLVGQNYDILTGKELSLFTAEMAAQISQFHTAVIDGSNVIVEVAMKNEKGDFFEAIVGLRPIYDQNKKYRYMILLMFNQRQRCSSLSCKGSLNFEEQYRMVALCHVHYLLDLISLIPTVFMDDDM